MTAPDTLSRIQARQSAAARLRLDRRPDALLAVLQASRDAERLPHRALMAELYWYLVENPA